MVTILLSYSIRFSYIPYNIWYRPTLPADDIKNCNSGATNDSLAWQLTDFFIDIVSKGLLPRQYFVICDEAVAADEWVLSPYGGHN